MLRCSGADMEVLRSLIGAEVVLRCRRGAKEER